MDKLVNKITFTCTDRLNETKNLEFLLKGKSEFSNEKDYNQHLIDRLNEFQQEANSLLTVIVNKEKEAIEAKLLTKCIEATKVKENEDDEEDDDDEDENEKENNNESIEERALKRDSNDKLNDVKSAIIEDQPVDKKQCLN